MKKFAALFFLAAVFSLLFLNKMKIEQLFRFTQSETDVLKKLASIPSEDQEKLETFFKVLIKDHDFAYTLFGEKPCSIAPYIKTTQFSHSLMPLRYF
jgi:hypothetical protein